MPEIPEGMAPARYKGLGAGLREGMKYFNADGTRRESVDLGDGKQKGELSLEPGDELLWADEDVYGKTLWHDPNQNLRSKYIGLGRCVMPGGEGKSERELINLGYEFHSGRSDVEALEPLEKFLKRKTRGKKSKEIPQTVVIEQPAEEQDPRDAMYQEIEDMERHLGVSQEESGGV